MRPLLLEFQAFGSFPGRQQVDFRALGARGLFVVTGPTGTGKTTVFDAMVYALYGALPGGRSADGDPRSHFADPGTDTFVRLDFEVDGVCYRVHRAPRQERPKQRGQGTTSVGPTATVVKVVDGVDEPLETQASRCAKKCEELVGLDARQFQRVVLLPQGKFTDFLIATDDDREKLLRQLFGGELFEHATLLLKNRMLQLDQQVQGVDAEVDRHRKNANQAYRTVHQAWGQPDDGDPQAQQPPVEEWTDTELHAALAALQPARAAQQAALLAVQQSAAAAATARATAEGHAKLFDDAAAAAATAAELETVRPDIAALDAAITASSTARPVVVQHAAVVTARAAATTAADQLAAAHLLVQQGFATIDRPAPSAEAAAVAAAVQQTAAEVQAQLGQCRQAQQAVAEADAADTEHLAALQHHQQLTETATQSAEHVHQLAQQVAQLEPVAAQLAAHEQARGVAAARLADRTALEVAIADLQKAEAARDTTEHAYLQVMARFVATQAPRLAAELVPGQPCPVCGSCEHPMPAPLTPGDTVDHDAVEAAQQKWSKAAAEVATAEGAVRTLRTALGEHADDTVHDLQLVLAAVQADVAVASEAARELSSVRQQWQQSADARDAAAMAVQQAATALAGLQTRATMQREGAERLVAATAGLDVAALEATAATIDTLQELTQALPALEQAATVAATQHLEADKLLAAALHASGLASVDAAHAVVLPEADQRDGAQRVAQWRQSLQKVTTELEVLIAQGVPDERPDVLSLVQADEALSEQAKAAAAAFTTADNAYSAAQQHLHEAGSVAADSAELREQRDDARIVFRTCNGEAGMRVKLERWVLAGELQRVTTAANEHLARMTNHRYRLGRGAASKGGLGLEVFDSHTGRARATASLSGGEQFQASLSLALGLADVVSHGGSASGKQFEALFVDEGFGSLDPDALDDAIGALGQLHAMGRMVGAITHVEAMKQQLHVGIEVSRLPDGKGSTLKVHP